MTCIQLSNRVHIKILDLFDPCIDTSPLALVYSARLPIIHRSNIIITTYHGPLNSVRVNFPSSAHCPVWRMPISQSPTPHLSLGPPSSHTTCFPSSLNRHFLNKMPHMARMNQISSPSRDMSKRMESLCLDSSPDFGPVRCETNKVHISPCLSSSQRYLKDTD